jgi:glycosyltransferase involved in cell wall biosynthesis|tara:strand:+ start:160 stop:1299 length:1140 start_codon:yes stop_codon:yes gene_type:complete
MSQIRSETIILYRVIQGWRSSIFEKLSAEKDVNLEVWHGPDFPGTKVVSTKNELALKRIKLWSFRIKLESVNGLILMPFSPFLFFSLMFKNPKVVICEGASNLVNSMIAFIYCKIFGKKYIWWSLGKLQGRVYDNKRSVIDRIITFIERKSDRIITYSSVGKRYFKSLGINDNKIIVAVNVIDTESKLDAIHQYEDAKGLKEQYKQFDFIALFVGALTKEKSIERLLIAQKKLEDKNLNIGSIIVGDGSHREELEKEVKRLQVKHVDFVGKKVSDSYKYFSIANLFVLPGLGGLAISEAMCYGLPVISSIGDGCEVDLVTKENGIVDKEMNSEKLADYIQYFYDNRETTKTFGEKSKEIIIHQYNSQNYIKMIKHAIND